jgi:hypothetical protein
MATWKLGFFSSSVLNLGVSVMCLNLGCGVIWFMGLYDVDNRKTAERNTDDFLTNKNVTQTGTQGSC